MWPRNDGISPVPAGLGRRRPRLGELARDPPDLHDRQRGAVREHGRHLQEDLQLLADGDRREVIERLGAVARLEEEGPAVGHLGERRTKLARLAGEDERRHGREPSRDGLGRSSLGHSGWWSAGYERQDDGDQTEPVTAIARQCSSR